MTNRFAHLQKLVSIRRDIRAFPSDTDRILLTAIVRVLPEKHKGIYFYAQDCAGQLTSAFVAEHWKLSLSHASSILNELWTWGLLKREAVVSERGKGYRYERVNV